MNIILCIMLFKPLKIKDCKIEIGQWIKVLRKQAKLSQQELADTLNVSRITIQNVEAGKNFTIDTLLKLLMHFDKMAEFNQYVVSRRKEQEDLKSLY